MSPISEKDFANHNEFEAWRKSKFEELRTMITPQNVETRSLQAITRGSRVKFDKEGTTLTGTVFNITTDISNGRKIANVEIEHELPGVIEIVPMDQLTPAPISQNIVFVTSPADALKADVGNRRFMTLGAKP